MGTGVNGPASVAGREIDAAVTPGLGVVSCVDPRGGEPPLMMVRLGLSHAHCRRPPVGAWLDVECVPPAPQGVG